jgi:hypothetical protein
MSKQWTKEELKVLEECTGEELSDIVHKFPGRTTAAIQKKREVTGFTLNAASETVVGKSDNSLSTKVHSVIKGGRSKHFIAELADKFDVPPKAIREAAEELKSKGFLVTVDHSSVWMGDPVAGGVTVFPEDRIDLDGYTGRVLRFGLCSDNHLCSRYERLDVLNALYDLYEQEGINVVYNCGNWIDGEARFNKNDIHQHGMGNQFRYFAKNYPKKEGMITYCIGGDDHEGWYTQREGIDLGMMFKSYVEKAGREDLEYLGYMEHDIMVPAPRGETRIRLVHAGGGSAYAISYTTQKLIESLTGGEKPEILLIGHYHKAEYLQYRNIHAVQAGCTQDQTPFMRKKRLSAHVGGWIIEAHVADDGSVRRFKSEFINFYDSAYHQKEWEYKQEAA